MKRVVKHQLAYWFPVYIWAVLIFYFSSGSLTLPAAPPIMGNVVFRVSDYYKHIFGYGFLTFLLWRTFHNSKFKYPSIFAIVITFLYGGFNEAYQSFIPGRSPSLFDVFSNLIGCVLVQPLITAYKKILIVKRRKD